MNTLRSLILLGLFALTTNNKAMVVHVTPATVSRITSYTMIRMLLNTLATLANSNGPITTYEAMGNFGKTFMIAATTTTLAKTLHAQKYTREDIITACVAVDTFLQNAGSALTLYRMLAKPHKNKVLMTSQTSKIVISVFLQNMHLVYIPHTMIDAILADHDDQ